MSSVAPKKLSPVMRQYEEAKSAHPDAILFFRLGDFYEMFHEDAVIASKALDLTLTSRDKNGPDQVPMAGVPYHAAHGYIAKLLALGHKVALCEQMGDPSKLKGICPRQVVRVVTPGLVTDTDQLDARENHYLVAVDGALADSATGSFGLALLDLSTGELSVATAADSAVVLAEIVRADPREAILAPELDALRATLALAAPRCVVRVDEPLADREVASAIDAAVATPLGVETVREHPRVEARAAARALRFARRCTPSSPVPVRRIGSYDPSGTLAIDETAQIHLELVRASDGGRKGSLLDVVDATVTPAGARLLRRRLLAPLRDVAAIRRRLDAVETFVTHARIREELRSGLRGTGDLERLGVRAALGEATPRDLGAMRDGLHTAPGACAIVRSIPDLAARELFVEPDPVEDLAARLAAALVDRPPPHAREGGIVRDGFDGELDEQRALKKNATELVAELEVAMRSETGISSLRVKYTSVFGYYIEVTRANLSKVPPGWRRKQTVSGGERYTTDGLDDLADRIEHAESRALERETALFAGLVADAAREADRVRALARTLAEWDVAAALADIAHRCDFARPDVDDGDVLAIEEGRHPVVERFAAAGRFVSNSTVLDVSGERLWLVTGPNMAGKSTLMRQVALIVVLAQMGSFVPAASARVGLVDRILSRVGASDNLARGESTFMVEMRETAAILRQATSRSLVILDEIGRGTSTFDGLAIAWAVAEHLHDAIGCRAMFATHYHELTDLARTRSGVANHSVTAREHEGTVVFLHKLAAGPASQSYGIAVARLAGVPESVLGRAKALLASLESGGVAPGGGAQPVCKRTRGTAGQLDLFEAPKPEAGAPALEVLRAVDVDRLTPLDALALVAKLKAMVAEKIA